MDDDQKLRMRLVGSDGRRRYDRASRDRLVAACLEPGVSVSRLALEHGINANLLRKWVKEVREAATVLPPSTSAFVPVQVTTDDHLPIQNGALDKPATQSEEGLVTSERLDRLFSPAKVNASLPNGVKLTLECGDTNALAAIIGALVLMLFGGPGGGKSHLAAAIGAGLIENGWRVLYTRTTDLVQKLQAARRNLDLEGAIAKLDKYHLLVLDDMAYVSKDQAETSVLFELISARYERRSLLITANQPFGEWEKVFPDKAMTLAAIDRLVHHATIFEMNVESYRRKTAMNRLSESPDGVSIVPASSFATPTLAD